VLLRWVKVQGSKLWLSGKTFVAYTDFNGVCTVSCERTNSIARV